MLIRIAHSPDPDDAFMFYGLSSGAVPAGSYQFEHILEDIQTLNERAMRGVYEITAFSIHAYPYLADKYSLTACGSSMGDNYGPIVVSKQPLTIADLRGRHIAIPGKMTTAFLALQLLLGRGGERGAAQGAVGAFTYEVVMFDQIPAAVAAGRVDAGLVIHEGQLTYQREGLQLVVDLGVWWQQQTGLPLPLGGNGVRRDLGAERCRELTGIVRASIDYSLNHRQEAVAYALRYGRGLDHQLADRFVGMYVNEWTRDYGPRGREAVRRLLAEGAAAGLVPAVAEPEFL